MPAGGRFGSRFARPPGVATGVPTVRTSTFLGVPLEAAVLLAWLALCVGGGAVAGVLTAGGDSAWYQALDKPAWTPPGWIFAPVWTTLYALMGIAAWLVWRRGGWDVRAAPLSWFVVQLGLNFAWSFLFFGLQQIGWALADIALLWVAIAVTIGLFARVSRGAAWMLAPYLAWVTFAAALNTSIFLRN